MSTQPTPRPPDAPLWHALSAEEALVRSESGSHGLAPTEAARRLATTGPNALRSQPPVPAWRLLLDEFRSPLIGVLLAAAALLVAVALAGGHAEHLVDAGLIAAIVALNAALGFVQNYRASRGMQALARMAAQHATVLRDGTPQQVPAADLVPGDVVLLEEGDRVPADGRLLHAAELQVDESALTGESVPVHKTPAAVGEQAPLAERGCMVYASTVAMRGRGRAVVTATGMATEVGRIAEAVASAPTPPTSFQREVGRLGARIGWAVAGLIALIAVVQLLQHQAGLLETFVGAVALAVAAIPEGLPVVLTLALAFGTRRMLERNALVRSLPVVEVVGAAETICTDKTGTITEGRMAVRVLAAPGAEWLLSVEREAAPFEEGPPLEERLARSLLVAGLCNNARPHPELGFVGDPTETALLDLAFRAGVDPDAHQRLAEAPFSSERRMMSVTVRSGDETWVLTKGAPEAVLPHCTAHATPTGTAPLDEAARDAWLALNGELGGRALRVLALAARPATPADQASLAEEGLTLLALVGIADPPRPEAAAAIAAAQRAGIRVVMITGDNLHTARAVAADVGLDGEGMEASALDGLDAEGLADAAARVSVFARAEPRHKVMILSALQAPAPGQQPHVVLMTGDGVNDAPALRSADVGIAMGIRGTDVARDAAGMVLLDDNFASIVSAVEEGRRIFRNIRKFVFYLLAGNLVEVAVVLVASLFGHLPLTAVQILWVNLVTDSGPAIALGIDPPSPGAMRKPPHRGPILDRAMFATIGAVGALMAAMLLTAYFVGLERWGLETARTMIFTGLVLAEYLKVVVLRVQERQGLLVNRWLVGAVLASLAVQMGIIYSPLAGAFSAVPLGVGPWAVLAAVLTAGLAGALVISRLLRSRMGAQ
jgi:Ca2+-transporting ATPase